jgi:PH/SEC7 domain-containing protein
MPPPGYSKDRQHVFVLTLANGGSYFFQAGTEDLVNEWVSTCNYWSARTSKEPLSGGVSNMEYGWNRVPKRDDDDTVEDMASIRSGKSGRSAKSGKSRTSYQGSVGRDGVSFSHQNPNDRLFINEWKPPQPPAVSSTLGEESQFENLKRHAHLLQTDLEKHNELRTPMMKLVSPKGTLPNLPA